MDGTPTAPAPSDDELADLAERVLSLARRVTLLSHRDGTVVPLSQLEALLMRHVDEHPGCSPSALAAHLGLKSSNTSAALTSLEKRGLIVRRVDSRDGRSVKIHPTPLAHQNRRLLRGSWGRLLETLNLDGDSVRAALTILTAMDDGLDEAMCRPTT